MKALGKMFLQGLLLILPAVITVALIVWLVNTVEPAMKWLITLALPEERYHVWMGIVTPVVLIFVAGLLARLWVFRQVIKLFERILEKIPLISAIYSAVKDFTDFLDSSDKTDAQQVVSIDPLENGCHLIGLVMREDLENISESYTEGTIAVYLPMSYQIGGFTVMVDRSRVTRVDMTIEEGMRFAMTAGVARKKAVGEDGDRNAPPELTERR